MDDDNTLDLFTEPPPPEGDFLTLGNYAERQYLDYAVSVVKGRSIGAAPWVDRCVRFETTDPDADGDRVVSRASRDRRSRTSRR